MTKTSRSTTNPHSLLEAATSFRQAAAAMVREGPDPLFREQVPAFYLLVGFGYEAVLKSQLRLLGWHDVPDLKNIGHDLTAAAIALAELSDDVEPLPARLPEILAQLGPHHMKLTMRYIPATGSFSLPHPSVALAVLGELTEGMAFRLRHVPDDPP